MCKNVEAVLNTIPKCTVTMEGKTYSTSDFVVVIPQEDGNHTIFYNTDAMTMGIAMEMVSATFVEMMNDLSEEDRYNIQQILTGQGA